MTATASSYPDEAYRQFAIGRLGLRNGREAQNGCCCRSGLDEFTSAGWGGNKLLIHNVFFLLILGEKSEVRHLDETDAMKRNLLIN